MAKNITKIVLTGGPAAGKTTLISRILKEFNQEDGWKVITIPETATDMISGFGIGPFENCMSMEDFQYFVIADQLHKEQIALKAAEIVPQDKILIIYDRAIFDDRAYIDQKQFEKTLAHFNTTPEEILTHYDAVMHLVTCAKGAEFAYNFDNVARYEDVDVARMRDDNIIEAWSIHPNVHIIDNSVDFEDKINRAISEIYKIIGLSMPDVKKSKYLISMPDERFLASCNATIIEMMQTYLANTIENVERRIRKQKDSDKYLFFYTEKRLAKDGTTWVTEKRISEKEYDNYMREADTSLSSVSKKKYRFEREGCRMEIDIYPFSAEKAILFVYGNATIPSEINIIQDVSGDFEYKNRRLARKQSL